MILINFVLYLLFLFYNNNKELFYFLPTYKTIVSPKWITFPTDTTKVLGDTVVIHCHASGHPKPVITWSKRNPFGNPIGSRFIDIQETMNDDNDIRYVKKTIERKLSFCLLSSRRRNNSITHFPEL